MLSVVWGYMKDVPQRVRRNGERIPLREVWQWDWELVQGEDQDVFCLLPTVTALDLRGTAMITANEATGRLHRLVTEHVQQ